jgi:hypothetical protein
MVAANLNAQINILKMTEQIFSICFGVILERITTVLGTISKHMIT